MGAVGGSALCECVCVLCVTQKRDNYVVGVNLLSSLLKPVISENDGVLHLLQWGYLFHSVIITLLIY